MTFNEKLQNCKSIKEVFDTVNEYYATDDQLPMIQRMMIQTGIKQAIKTINPRPKK